LANERLRIAPWLADDLQACWLR